MLLLSQACDITSKSRGNALVQKQAQLITMHSQEFYTKVVQSKGWLSVWILYIFSVAITFWIKQ